MVHAVLGPPVPWPIEDDLRELTSLASGALSLVARDAPEPTPPAEPEDEGDEDLQVLDNFQELGFYSMLTPVADAEGEPAVPIADQPAGERDDGDGHGKGPGGDDGDKQVGGQGGEEKGAQKKDEGGKKDKGGKKEGGKRHKKDTKDKKDRKDKKKGAEDKAEKAGGRGDKPEGGAKAAAGPPAKRTLGGGAKRSYLEPGAKAWIQARHAADLSASGRSRTSVMPTKWFENALAEGMAGGSLGPFATQDGLRSHIRSLQAKAAAAERQGAGAGGAASGSRDTTPAAISAFFNRHPGASVAPPIDLD